MIVSELLRQPGARGTGRPLVSRLGGDVVVELGGQEIHSVVHEFVDLDAIVAAQAERGIERVVLSPWVPLLFGEAPVEEARRRCRLQNKGLARLHEERPDQLSVLGAVPLQDPELASWELRELMGGGDFAGVEVTTRIGERYLGDPVFEPFWAAAEETGALVFVHPTTRGFGDPVFDAHHLWNVVGNPFETTLAAAHLVLSGTMERHPGLRVLLAHAGGAVLALRGRLRHAVQTVAAAGPSLREPADQTIGRFLFDTVTHDPELLRGLVELVGPGQVLLGSDYPFDMGDPDPVATVRAAGLGDAAQSAVLGANAEALLGFAGVGH